MNSLRLTWLLLALNLIAGTILLMIYFEDQEPELQTVAARQLNFEMPAVPTYQSGSDSNYSAVMSHPLFNESRLPEEEPEESQATEQDTQESNASELILVGVVISPDETQALLQKKDRSIERVSLGETIDGWELKSVEPASVVLVKAGLDVELTLERTSPVNTRPDLRAKRRALLRKRQEN